MRKTKIENKLNEQGFNCVNISEASFTCSNIDFNKLCNNLFHKNIINKKTFKIISGLYNKGYIYAHVQRNNNNCCHERSTSVVMYADFNPVYPHLEELIYNFKNVVGDYVAQLNIIIYDCK